MTTTYRITTRHGRVVEGRIQGSGGMLSGSGGLTTLERLATTAVYTRAYQPAEGHVRVYPDYCAAGNGEHVGVDIRGARVGIVEAKRWPGDT